MARKLADLVAVDSAVQPFRLLRLAAHHKMHGKAVDVAILERERLFEKHRSRNAAVAVNQRKATARLTSENIRGEGQYGRDAATRCEGHVGMLSIGADRGTESPHRRTDVDQVAGMQFRREFAGHPAAHLQSDA